MVLISQFMDITRSHCSPIISIFWHPKWPILNDMNAKELPKASLGHHQSNCCRWLFPSSTIHHPLRSTHFHASQFSFPLQPLEPFSMEITTTRSPQRLPPLRSRRPPPPPSRPSQAHPNFPKLHQTSPNFTNQLHSINTQI